MTVTRHTDRKALATLLLNLKQLDGLQAKVGWITPASYENGMPVAAIAGVQEFGATINHPGGTPYKIGPDGRAVFVSKASSGAAHLPVTKPHTITIPPRPFMRPTIAAQQAAWSRSAAQGAKAIFAGKMTAQQVMELIGLKAAGDVAKTITEITTPPLKKSTIAARRRQMADKVTIGNLDKPLVFSGIMLAGLSSAVEKAGDESSGN